MPASPDRVLTIELENTLPICAHHVYFVKPFSRVSIVKSNVVFWSPEVKVGELAAFQLSMTAPASASISSIPFTQLKILFAQDVSRPITVHHQTSNNDNSSVRRVYLGNISKSTDPETVLSTDLSWAPGATVVFAGCFLSETPAKVEVGISLMLNISRLNHIG